jgi:hypothetical protein
LGTAVRRTSHRKHLDELYNPSLISVGTFKASAYTVGKGIWVCNVHFLVAGVDEQSELERVFGGSWQHVEQPSELRVRRVVDLSKAIKSVFSTRFKWRVDPFESSDGQTLRFKAMHYSWLFSQKPDERVIRYGCDRHLNMLKKNPRVFKAKAPRRKRPYPYWLERYMFGEELRDDFVAGSKMANRRFRKRNPLMAEIYFGDPRDPIPDTDDKTMLLDLNELNKKRRR